jgi:hypothetical protein
VFNARFARLDKIDKNRHSEEIAALKTGFTAEMLSYSHTIIEETSKWNHRAYQPYDFPPMWGISEWPVFRDPHYYIANVGRIGLIKQQRTAAAIIGFYSNLLECNQRITNARSAHPVEADLSITSKAMAISLNKMASDLAKALSGLNNAAKLPIPSDLEVPILSTPQGIIGNTERVPENLHDLLLRLTGPLPDFP